MSSPSGRFVWHDLMTTSWKESVAFYTSLFRWKTEPFPIEGGHEYTMIRNGERRLGGIIPMDESHGVRSHWIGYVAVDDVAAAAAAAARAGGEVPVPPTDIPGVGRFAVISHPGGAFISPIQLAPGAPAAENVEGAGTAPGVICWDQLMAKEPEEAAKFFEQVFGWEAETRVVADDQKFWVFKRDGAEVAGMIPCPPDYPDLWIAYVEVDDVDDACTETERLGGAIMVPPSDIPGIGRFAVTADPSGAVLALSRQAGA